MGPVIVGIGATRRPAHAEFDARDDGVPVDGVSHGLAHPDVVEGRFGMVEAVAPHMIGRSDVHLEVGIIFDGVVLRLAQDHVIDLVRFQIGELNGCVRDDGRYDTIEVRHVRLADGLAEPPVGIPLYFDEVAGAAILQDVGACACRMGIVLFWGLPSTPWERACSRAHWP